MTILVVGGGKMGLSHLAIARRIARPVDVAICDANWVTRFLYRKLGIKVYKTIDEALSSAAGRIKAVIVATPTPSHYIIAQKVLDRSIPCFIEKPLSLNSKRSLALKELAERRGVYAQVGFVLRYVATFSRLRDLVRSGELGSVLGYQAQMNGNVITSPDEKNWRTDFTAGGGCLNEYGPHLIDLCRFIFGDVATLKEATKGHVHSTRADDKITFSWAHISGVPGEVMLDWCDTTKRKSVIRFSVELEHAQITTDNSALQVNFRDTSHLSGLANSHLASLQAPPRVSYYLRGEEYSLQLEDFLGCSLGQDFRADNNFGIGNQASLSDGLAVDQLIESISEMAGLR